MFVFANPNTNALLSPRSFDGRSNVTAPVSTPGAGRSIGGIAKMTDEERAALWIFRDVNTVVSGEADAYTFDLVEYVVDTTLFQFQRKVTPTDVLLESAQNIFQRKAKQLRVDAVQAGMSYDGPMMNLGVLEATPGEPTRVVVGREEQTDLMGIIAAFAANPDRSPSGIKVSGYVGRVLPLADKAAAEALLVTGDAYVQSCFSLEQTMLIEMMKLDNVQAIRELTETALGEFESIPGRWIGEE